ncbi:MAG: M48 family metallopeptidase [Thermodesulfobacteriota bacterium]
MNIYLAIIIFSLIAVYILEGVGQLLNIRALDTGLPEEFRDTFDENKYKNSQEYTRKSTKLNLISSTVNLAVVLGFILLGGFPWLDSLLRGLELSNLFTGLLFFAVLAVAQGVIGEPFELYRTFVLEEKFGFNRMTLRTYLGDKLKELLLILLIGGPVLAGFLLFLQNFTDWGWFYAWMFIVLVMLVLQYIAPTWILPLFNKFTPLEEGELKSKIMQYAQRMGFDLSGIFVMDGSKRSTKSNAFFTGFGKKKRIALFDTLIEKHEPDELVSVLAHEVGHFKLKHILKNILLGIFKTGVLLYIMSFFITHEPLFEAFGMQNVSVYAGLVFFMLLYTPVSIVLALFVNSLSRKYEYQADAFAAKTTGDSDSLVRALKRLSADNLSNLTPHPFYVFLEYAHPPVLHRIRELKQNADI